MSTTKFDYELFFELTADLFCIAGYDGYFKKINPAAVGLTGHTEEELLARPIVEFVYPEDLKIYQSEFEGLYKTKTHSIQIEWVFCVL